MCFYYIYFEYNPGAILGIFFPIFVQKPIFKRLFCYLWKIFLPPGVFLLYLFWVQSAGRPAGRSRRVAQGLAGRATTREWARFSSPDRAHSRVLARSGPAGRATTREWIRFSSPDRVHSRVLARSTCTDRPGVFSGTLGRFPDALAALSRPARRSKSILLTEI